MLPEPDLNTQLLILAGMFAIAIAACLVIEMRAERKDDRQLRDREEQK